MKFFSMIFYGPFIFCLMINCLFAQNVKEYPGQKQEVFEIKQSPELQKILDDAANKTLESSKSKIGSDEIAVTLIDFGDPKKILTANINGEAKFYPASVVKMFYMVALHRWLEDGKLKPTPELERGLRDMIVDSSNDATHYILDVLTDTSSGGEMPAEDFKIWSYKRNAVNRYFAANGFKNINVNQKTYCEDAYGREQQFRSYKGENRNMLTTNATARLLAEIAAGNAVTKARSAQMMNLMKREPFAETADLDDQASGFIGAALKNLGMKDARLWSKAGWTSKSRHDAAYVETEDGFKFVLVIFTENQASSRDLIPAIAEKVIKGLQQTKQN